MYDPTAVNTQAFSVYDIQRFEGGPSFGFTHFQNGPMHNVETHAAMERLIGIEDNNFVFLNPGGTGVSRYSIQHGHQMGLNYTWTHFSGGGNVNGMSIEEALTSGKFLGVGDEGQIFFSFNAIPEPSSIFLVTAAAGLLVMRRWRPRTA